MPRIAITGGIACGKSLAGRCFRAAGFEVLEADEVGHELLMEPAVAERVASVFGRHVLGTGGLVDRARLARIVFASPRRLAELNAMTHPEILRRCESWVGGVTAAGRAAAVVVPLLFEAGCGGGWDAVVTVCSSRSVQRARLRARGLKEDEIEARVSAQMPLAEKERLADYVLRNDGTEDILRRQVEMVVSEIGNK